MDPLLISNHITFNICCTNWIIVNATTKKLQHLQRCFPEFHGNNITTDSCSLHDLNSMSHYIVKLLLRHKFPLFMCNFSNHSLLYKQNSKSSCCQKAWSEVCPKLNVMEVLTSFNQVQPVSTSFHQFWVRY